MDFFAHPVSQGLINQLVTLHAALAGKRFIESRAPAPSQVSIPPEPVAAQPTPPPTPQPIAEPTPIATPVAVATPAPTAPPMSIPSGMMNKSTAMSPLQAKEMMLKMMKKCSARLAEALPQSSPMHGYWNKSVYKQNANG